MGASVATWESCTIGGAFRNRRTFELKGMIVHRDYDFDVNALIPHELQRNKNSYPAVRAEGTCRVTYSRGHGTKQPKNHLMLITRLCVLGKQ
jgi:hypothetical protein